MPLTGEQPQKELTLLIEPVDEAHQRRMRAMARIPARMPGCSIEFPPPKVLFASAQEAHDFLMEIVADVCRELRAAGVKLPRSDKFSRDVSKIWRFWQNAGYFPK